MSWLLCEVIRSGLQDGSLRLVDWALPEKDSGPLIGYSGATISWRSDLTGSVLRINPMLKPAKQTAP